MAAVNSAAHELRLVAVRFCISSVHESFHIVSSESPFCVSDLQDVMKKNFPVFPTVPFAASQSTVFAICPDVS